MSSNDFTHILFTLSVLLVAVHSFGYLAQYLKQPRIIGEISAGILFGPFILGKLMPELFEVLFSQNENIRVLISFLSRTGLVLLMFLSGCETKKIFSGNQRTEIVWLIAVGTFLPLLAIYSLGITGLIGVEKLTGTANHPVATLILLGVATSVTSIPVISRIFHDLNIIKTRFAGLILGMAVLEDIILWCAVTVAIRLPSHGATSAWHVAVSETILTIIFVATSILVTPKLLVRIHNLRINLIRKASPVGYALCWLFIFSSVGSMIGINIVFASFLAGFCLAGGVTEKHDLTEPINAISKISFGIFIPLYFFTVGYDLVFSKGFSGQFLITFFVGTSLLSISSKALASFFAGFRGLDIANISITSNARGGPGIVLATVGYESGIISGEFYTALVITAILTSQVAGLWLRQVLDRRLPLIK